MNKKSKDIYYDIISFDSCDYKSSMYSKCDDIEVQE